MGVYQEVPAKIITFCKGLSRNNAVFQKYEKRISHTPFDRFKRNPKSKNASRIVKNEDEIVTNEDAIIKNATRIVINQDAFVKNEVAIVKNKDGIVTNEDAFVTNEDGIVKNQDEFITNEESIVLFQVVSAIKPSGNHFYPDI